MSDPDPNPQPDPGHSPGLNRPSTGRILPAVRAVEAGEETETARGWHYAARVFWEGGRLTEHHADLDWADHDHWSGGTKPPSQVIEAVIHAAASALGPDDLPEKFNASSLRSRVPGLDERVRERL